MQEAFEEVKKKLTSPPVLAFSDFEKSFVVETDASSVDVGAVLAQHKEDGKCHPVQYASRTMNDAEKKYSACEREALAVILALKKFRVYLLSTQKFILVTDHQALQYAFRKKDIHGRLARWMDFLAEYEFKVQYRPGNKNKAADALSRLCIGENQRGDTEDDGDFVCSYHNQVFDGLDLEPHLNDITRYLNGGDVEELDSRQRRLNRRDAKRFLTHDGNIFRRTTAGLRAIPAQNACKNIVRAFHDGLGHWELETTRKFVLVRYWWPGVLKDLADYVRGCDGCQKATTLPKYKTTLHFPITSLFGTFSVDFAWPLPRSDSAKRYVLVAVEHLSGWPIAKPTATSTAEEVVKFIEEEIVYSFSSPGMIVSENATWFTAAELDNLMKKHGIERKTVLAYAPMSNGRAERMIGTLKRAARKQLDMGGSYTDRCIWVPPQTIGGRLFAFSAAIRCST